MFTGIIQHVGVVTGAAASPSGGRRLTIDLGPLADGLTLGGSVAVNGACLTASHIAGRLVGFDAVPETLERTTVGRLKVGGKVNLERSLRADGLLEGHVVQGHVDGLAELRSIRSSPAGHVLEFAADESLARQLVPKGSIAIDGVSLTLVDATAEGFWVALIPTTLRDTTLGGLREGSAVNIELDILGKYVRRYLQQLTGGEGLTMEQLRRAGFVE